MLKTSSTESAEPRMGVVGVGSGGKNRAEPVDKHEGDGGDNGSHDDGGSCSNNFDKKFYLMLQYDSRATYLNTQDKLINKFIN